MVGRFIFALVLVVALVACGGTEGSDDTGGSIDDSSSTTAPTSSSDDTSTELDTTTTSTSGPVELGFTMAINGQDVDVREDNLCDPTDQNPPGIGFNVESADGSITAGGVLQAGSSGAVLINYEGASYSVFYLDGTLEVEITQDGEVWSGVASGTADAQDGSGAEVIFEITASCTDQL